MKRTGSVVYSHLLGVMLWMGAGAVGAAPIDFSGPLAVIDVDSGSGFTQVWSLSGQQQTASSDPFTQASVDLSGYSGDIDIRFRVVAAGGMGGYGGRTDPRGIWRKHWLFLAKAVWAPLLCFFVAIQTAIKYGTIFMPVPFEDLQH